METIDRQEMYWANLMHQLENNTTFSERQFHSIGYIVSSLKVSTEKKISIIEEIIKLNPKQSQQ
jgi:hypothetical protein